MCLLVPPVALREPVSDPNDVLFTSQVTVLSGFGLFIVAAAIFARRWLGADVRGFGEVRNTVCFSVWEPWCSPRSTRSLRGRTRPRPRGHDLEVWDLLVLTETAL